LSDAGSELRPLAGVPGSGPPDSGTPGSGTPGSGTPGSGTPGSGTPGSGTPGSGTPGSEAPDSATPKQETPAADPETAKPETPAGSADSETPKRGAPRRRTPKPETPAAADSETTKPDTPGPGSTDLGPDQGSSDLSGDERAELTRLRAEVAELRTREDQLRTREADLRGQEAAVAVGARRRRRGWRAPVSAVLIVIGCILAPISVVAVWTANQVSDTNRYIENIEPLIHDPAVQGALTDKVTVAITSHLNITGYTNQAASLLTSKGLPRVGTLLKTFGPAIASSVAGFIHGQVSKIVTSPQFANTWIQVNRTAHATLVKALSGRGGAITVSNGNVVIDLAPFVAIVKQALVARGFSIVNSLPPIHPTLTLFSSKTLVQAQTLYRLINDLKIVLPILCLLLLAAGVYIARGHRRALIGAGLGFATSMLVLGLGLLIFRGIYLNSVPNNVLPSNAAAVIFDTFVRFIKEALRTLLVVGLVVAIGAFFSGPSVTAVRSREAVKSGFARIRGFGEREGVTTGPVGRWTYRHRQALRIGAVGLIALIFVFWGRPTAVVVIWLAVLLLVLLGLIELIGRPPARPEAASQP
jgi:hypothetical protein